MAYIPALPALHTPSLTGAESGRVLTMAYAAGDDSEAVALADLFASLGAQADSGQQRSDAAAALHAALLTSARTTAARLS